ncbi:hypothetical protein IHE45_03G008300 [Dioscorea alata]|uniref:Uncharacterized protein n=1 Tax=Dioscorea alata TaxID=55571 RepID=A0ACB7WIE3_DIOAL|nr:hypothetical protein IHE45_03G008300 [Dioscorea alata]
MAKGQQPATGPWIIEAMPLLVVVLITAHVLALSFIGCIDWRLISSPRRRNCIEFFVVSSLFSLFLIRFIYVSICDIFH